MPLRETECRCGKHERGTIGSTAGLGAPGCEPKFNCSVPVIRRVRTSKEPDVKMNPGDLDLLLSFAVPVLIPFGIVFVVWIVRRRFSNRSVAVIDLGDLMSNGGSEPGGGR